METDHVRRSCFHGSNVQAATSGDLARFGHFNGGLSLEEHYELVESVLPLRGSVGRIILENKKKKGEVIQTGTATLVYKGDERSLFVTCSHNFGKKMSGEVIRLHVDEDTVRDYPIENIVYRHEDRDLLFFSVKDLLPQHKCLEFSTDQVKRKDKVVLLGFADCPLLDKNKELVDPAPVVAHSILTGVVSCGPIISETDQHHEKMYYNCRVIKVLSGSPVFKNDGKLVAVHIAADKNWRDGVPTNTTVRHCLREHLELGTDEKATFDELLKGLCKKSGHLPYGKCQPVKKKSKGKGRA